MTYKHYPTRPSQLTREFAQEEFKKLLDRIPESEAAPSADKWKALFADWNELKAFISGEGSRIHYKLSGHMDDPALDEADRYYREQVTPVSDDGNSALVGALLASKYKHEVAEEYGPYLLAQLETSVEPLAPVNSELRVKISDLTHQYDKFVSKGEVTVDGKQVTLAVARSLGSHEDARIRKEAFFAYRGWFAEHHDHIAGLFDQMVKLRHQMAKNLGHENYIRLGYLWMGRTDYGPEQAAQFRENIRKYIVPLHKALNEEHARELGTDTLKPWDAGYRPGLSLPSGVAPVGTQIEKAEKVFTRLSPRLAEHFRRMVREGLIDLENRKSKKAGAYCTSFPDEGRVAIFCNSTGDEDDVRTLMHEMGHAFQAWESQRIEAVELQWPTSDAAEVHSMGMEYLSMPLMTEFFEEENAAKFRRGRWQQAIELLCYIPVVDEFQHWVYSNPEASIADRDVEWNRIWDTYKQGIDFSGVEEYKSMRWLSQGHIFSTPFYYIDYAIAETGAMQLALLDKTDHEQALDTYIKLCQIGGTMSVLDIFKSAGLRSPFDESLMRDLGKLAQSEIEAARAVHPAQS